MNARVGPNGSSIHQSKKPTPRLQHAENPETVPVETITSSVFVPNSWSKWLISSSSSNAEFLTSTNWEYLGEICSSVSRLEQLTLQAQR
ncbi:hypothetical protein ACTXT7_014901 [Hymenolepis weldensis]